MRAEKPERPEKSEELERPEGVDGDIPIDWGSDALAELLSRLDLRYLALVPGSSYRGLHDSLVNYTGNRDPRMLVCLHEEHAVAIAHGYAKVTGRPMAVALHSNVGLMHATMAIYNAWCDRVPMLIVGATGPVDAARRRPWIDWIHTSADQGALIRPYVKWDDQPASVEAALDSLAQAYSITRAAPSAPVYVCLDVSLQEQRLPAPPAIPDVRRDRSPRSHGPDAEAVRTTLDFLSRARRPLVEAGAEEGELAGPLGVLEERERRGPPPLAACRQCTVLFSAFFARPCRCCRRSWHRFTPTRSECSRPSWCLTTTITFSPHSSTLPSIRRWKRRCRMACRSISFWNSSLDGRAGTGSTRRSRN